MVDNARGPFTMSRCHRVKPNDARTLNTDQESPAFAKATACQADHDCFQRAGVGRARGAGRGLGVRLGLIVGVGEGLGVNVGVAEGVGVTVGVIVGVGEGDDDGAANAYTLLSPAT
jgi:hypothetical protein